MSNESRIWNYLIAKGLSACGAAGLMGNLKAESALKPQNLQNTFEKKLGYTDSEYTAAVDSGSYTNFARDSAGYGLAQWTYWSRKQALLAFAKEQGKSVGDLELQLDFLFKELSESYKPVLTTLKTATSVLEASNTVLLKFERPANQGESVQVARAKYGQAYYDKYAEQANDEGENAMSNSSLVDFTMISPHKDSPRNSAIKKITIHHMAGNLTVEVCGNVFQNREASSNYGIGTDGRVGMYVEEKDRSWCSSSEDNDHQAVTIEVANDGGDPDWHISDTALAKLIDLCADICQRNGIKQLNYTGDKTGNLAMHKWFAATACPGPYLESKFPYIAEEVNRRLGVETVPVDTGEIKLGDVVMFTGTKHYTSAAGSKGAACKPGAATVTNIAQGAKHPYHLIKVKDGGSNVYGWVDAADIGASDAAPEQPEPEVTREPPAPKSLDGFIAHLEEECKNHSIYVWGAQGQGKGTITEKWIRSRETSEKNANRAIAYWQAQVAAGYGNVLKAFDCSGLGMAYLQNEAEIVGSDMNANGMMGKCARLDRSKLRRGDWVFKIYTGGENTGRAYHIGYVVDDALNVIEALGRDHGVVKRHVDKGGWNAFGRPSYFKAEIEEQPDIGPRDLKLTSPMMNGEDVKALQEKLIAVGYSLGKAGADGIYGNDTDAAVKLFQQRAAGMTADICDEAMRAALNL